MLLNSSKRCYINIHTCTGSYFTSTLHIFNKSLLFHIVSCTVIRHVTSTVITFYCFWTFTGMLKHSEPLLRQQEPNDKAREQILIYSKEFCSAMLNQTVNNNTLRFLRHLKPNKTIWNGYNPELPVGCSASIYVVVKHLLGCYRWSHLTLNAISRKFSVVSAIKGKKCYSNKPNRNGTSRGKHGQHNTHKQGQLIWQVAQTNLLVWTMQTTQPREKWEEEEGLEKELNYHTDNSMPIRYC